MFYFAETCLFHAISVNNRNDVKKDDRKPNGSKGMTVLLETQFYKRTF